VARRGYRLLEFMLGPHHRSDPNLLPPVGGSEEAATAASWLDAGPVVVSPLLLVPALAGVLLIACAAFFVAHATNP
jgi:hypothetical protein